MNSHELKEESASKRGSLGLLSGLGSLGSKRRRSHFSCCALLLSSCTYLLHENNIFIDFFINVDFSITPSLDVNQFTDKNEINTKYYYFCQLNMSYT